MSGLQVTMTPEGSLSMVELDALILALKSRSVKEVLHAKEAAAFLGISESKLYRMDKKVVPYHKLQGLEARLYLTAELLEYIKKS